MNKHAYIDHAAITVKDIEWHIKFFEEILGMTITRRRENEGVLQQVWLDGGIQLIASDDSSGKGKAHHLGIRVQDFKNTLAKMLAYEKVNSIPGKPEKWVQLPDGVVLELFEMPNQ